MKLILPLALLLATASILSAEPARPIVGVDRAYIDSTVSPCKDFYGYANGAYSKVAIPGEYSAYGVNQEINERSYAILTDAGKIFSGCNVENASYGLSNCAERTAIFSAVAAGGKKLRIQCVVVYTPTQTATAPCGACRQVINEFGPNARVISICAGHDRLDVAMGALLPGAFGPEDLA